MSRSSRTLYVGNLPGDIREREVEDLFYKVFYLFLCCFLKFLYSHLLELKLVAVSKEVLVKRMLL